MIKQIKEWIYMHWPVYTQNQADLMDAYIRAMEEGLQRYAEDDRLRLLKVLDSCKEKTATEAENG